MTIIRCSVAVFAASLVLASAPASSQPVTDEKAIVEDAAVADILKGTSAQSEISDADARRFGPMMFKDGSLSANERDLIQELLANSGVRTTVTVPSGESFEIPPLSFRARGFSAVSCGRPICRRSGFVARRK